MDQENQNKHRRRRHRRPMQKNKPIQNDGALAPVKAEGAKDAALPDFSASPLPAENPAAAMPDAVQDAEPEKKDRVVGSRFRPVGKTYSFDPQDGDYNVGDQVIVETSQGLEFATVSSPARMASEREIVLPLKKILRRATDKDVKRNEENREQEKRGKKVFLEKVAEHKLEMALADVECSFDRSKMIFYFTSEGRVDFREFVKDLAGIFKTRIELRQIGVRDEAKQIGGLGICGRPLCCNSFLDDFQQVSIKMAKEQNLSLNPTKISGTCGRLMCCLRYENDVYVEAAKTCPRADACVMTPQGRGIVTESNLLCGRCKVRLDSDPDNLVPFSAQELKVIPKQKKTQNSPEQNSEK